MARAVSTRRKTINTLAAWAVALVIFFPILWTVLTSFKPEPVAVASPPVFLNFDWTMKNYQDVIAQRGYVKFFWNSVIISVGSTILGLDQSRSRRPGPWPSSPDGGPRTC